MLILNAGGWLLAFLAFSAHPLLMGTAVLAYSFGLRHAVDADHISAIDNVTRKLMQDHKRPVAVGFFFSLGHSTIVVALSAAIGFAAAVVKQHLPSLQSEGGAIGTSISALFLLVIAVVNMVVLWEIVQTFARVRRGEAYNDRTLDELLNQRGFAGRFCRPMLGLVSKSWHMYPLGVLFGLGFDTATEVGVLGIAAVEAGTGLPISAIMIFPLLFTAGMSLIDTTDGVLMLGAYGWAYLKPMRKLYYNMNITLVSVLAALLVGGLEAFGVIGNQLRLHGKAGWAIGEGGAGFGVVGYAIVGIFVVSWGLSALIYRLKGYDDFDPLTGRAASTANMCPLKEMGENGM